MQAANNDKNQIPQPFNETVWTKALRPAAQVLWQWHRYLAEPVVYRRGEADWSAFFEEESVRAEAGQTLRILPQPVVEAAYETCRAHNLPRALLADQVNASAGFLTAMRFETYAALQAFIQPWAGSQGRLLARLAGHKRSWQLPLVDELTRAFFLTGRLAHLPDDLARDRLYIPLDEMRHAGVSLEQLRAGEVDEAMRRLFWKQIVRVRDAFAQGQSLARDLPRWQRRVFKRWWLGGLELVNEIERRDYDVWSQPLTVSSVQRFRVRIQALAGRTSFR